MTCLKYIHIKYIYIFAYIYNSVDLDSKLNRTMQLVKYIYLFLLISFVSAYFSPAQLEILDLHYKIQPKGSSKDKNIRTFYSLLNVKPNVNNDELESSFRKLSRKLHPDKFIKADPKERRKAERKFETLSLVMTILRDVNRRKNYDYFIKNGFPTWDNNKAKYIFKNRSKPNFLFTILIIIILSSIGQILILKLNKSQKDKRISKILRDVKWKADHMNINDNNNENKILELPDNFDISNNSNFSSNYSVDDKLVIYCDKVFIVKPDRSVLLYNDETFNVNDESSMNDLIKKIIDSGFFNLYGFDKKSEMNRKERREFEKQNKKDSKNDDLNNVISKLVQFKEDDSNLKFSDLYLAKLFLSIWNSTIGKVISNGDDSNNQDNNNEAKNETENSSDSSDEVSESNGIESKPKSLNAKNEKLILNNGKSIRSRKNN